MRMSSEGPRTLRTAEDGNLTTSPPILKGPPVVSLYHPLKRTPEQPDRETAANAQPRQHQEEGFVGHTLPKRAEKPGEVVAEEAR